MRQTLLRYILGLDLGIASVGWAVVEIDSKGNPLRLIDVGVRTFEKAEVAKTGESLAASRRQARAVRRLIYRRAMRLIKAKRLLKQAGVLSEQDFEGKNQLKNLPVNTWQLRVEGLDRQLDNKEWAAVLLHLIKHRGYLSQRKSERKSGNAELGALLSGVENNHQLLQSQQYRTPAELALHKFEKEEGHIRNQRGAYTHTFNRLDLEQELQLLFSQQRLFGNPFTSDDLEKQFNELLMQQKPALSGDAILKMLGKCTFETDEYKAAKYTYSAERFVWLQKLNNLRLLELGSERALTEQERNILINEPYLKAKLTFEQIRKLLSLSDQVRFKGLSYAKENAEKTACMELKGYHSIRKALENNGLKTEWQGLATQPELLDEIGTAFSIYKTDDDIKNYLNGKISEPILSVLLSELNFDKFINLSLKALSKLLPLLEKGMRYDEACREIYGDHYGHKNKQQELFLPVIPADEIRNPVVLRTLTQARKIINAIVRLYGSPTHIHIETGRELGKSFQERREIEKRQLENQKQKEKAISQFKEFFPNHIGEPKAKDILKMRLYLQQDGKCLYSGHSLDLNKILENGYVEIDHALPFSRSWDDSLNNKVLVLKNQNQNKGNQTPYEWLDGKNNSERWKYYKARVEMSAFPYSKKQRILMQHLDEGFKAKNLNDTRYIARFLMAFIKNNMLILGEKNQVFASNGQITNFLRHRWGIEKVRSANDRHHAIDAVVVACSSVAMQQKITRFVRYKEMNPFAKAYDGEYIDPETGEILPPTFRRLGKASAGILIFGCLAKIQP